MRVRRHAPSHARTSAQACALACAQAHLQKHNTAHIKRVLCECVAQTTLHHEKCTRALKRTYARKHAWRARPGDRRATAYTCAHVHRRARVRNHTHAHTHPRTASRTHAQKPDESYVCWQ
eukprot:12796404-Alexandrium_andersonii.AAC.1